jgi:hypothetical protein
MAMQRIGCDDAAFEGQQRQNLQRPFGLVRASTAKTLTMCSGW